MSLEGRDGLLVYYRFHETEVEFTLLRHEDVHVVFVVGVRQFYDLNGTSELVVLDGKIDISSVNFSGNLKMCSAETLRSSYSGIVAFKYSM